MVDVGEAMAIGTVGVSLGITGTLAYHAWRNRRVGRGGQDEYDAAMGEEGRRVGEVLETAAAYDAYRNKHLDHGTGTKTSDPVYEGPAAAAHGQPTQRHGGRT